jgi:nitroreductase
MTAFAAITSRRSIRGFTDQPVPLDLVNRILEAAARAPSGTNMQPWKATVVTGAALKRTSDAVLRARHAGEEHASEYKYYPDKFPEPYITRRRKVGWDLYTLVGIQKGDTAKMAVQHDKNFTFFNAPVGIFFTIDKRLEIGSWLDYGMFIQNVMTAAREAGLSSCPQVAWAQYHKVLRAELGIPEGDTIVCGLALGYEDESEIANTLRTERAPLEDWVTVVQD